MKHLTLLVGCLLVGCNSNTTSPKIGFPNELSPPEAIIYDVELLKDLPLPEADIIEEQILDTSETDSNIAIISCQKDEDCEYGLCMETKDGYVCAMPCEKECPEGFYCVPIQGKGKVCIDLFPRLCRPCVSNEDCVVNLSPIQPSCLPVNDIYVCVIPCFSDKTCPNQYSCQKRKEGDICVPEKGQCECSPQMIAEHAKGVCFRKNLFGTCQGLVFCDKDGLSDCSATFPSSEICNLIDDDCNGITDDIQQKECIVPDTQITGLTECINGKEKCAPPKPKPEECNGKDDDLNGKTDEGFPDLDGDGIADCVDPDDDGDGISDGQDNCPTIENSNQTDMDNDGIGDLCDCDIDGDNLENMNPGCKVAIDNCPLVPNPNQDDLDKDGIGDACDPDIDGDGDSNSDDCAPNDPLVSHNQTEVCNGKDDNCDGLIDLGAKDCIMYYIDQDKDGYGSDIGKCLCKPDQLYSAILGGDCNDTDAGVKPLAKEKCNKKDDDCDGETDEENALGCINYYLDLDGDGYGISSDFKCLCEPFGKYTTKNGNDCNDLEFDVHPNAKEVCNNIDDDCDNATDEGAAIGCINYYKDGDGDGYGVGEPQCLCSPSQPYKATYNSDCNDLNPMIHPNAEEICNKLDDNCNGQTDEGVEGTCTIFYLDMDSDGFGVDDDAMCLCGPFGNYKAIKGGDCNDKDPMVNPSAKESCNNVDDNCNGVIDEEAADGCKVYYVDLDKDYYGGSKSRCLCKPDDKYVTPLGGDCNDENPDINPIANEICDNIDNDCDKEIDEMGSGGCQIYYKDEDMDSYGVTEDFLCLCKPEGKYTTKNKGDCDDNNNQINPAAKEACNGKDDNCNKVIDEGFLDTDLDQIADCVDSDDDNDNDPDESDCNPLDSNVYHGNKEVCNGKDDNCNDQIDENTNDCLGDSVCYKGGCWTVKPMSYCTLKVFGGHLYAFCPSQIKISWLVSSGICQNWGGAGGGNLVTFDNEAEYSWVMSNLNGNRCWIGYTDSQQEGTWMWVTPSSFPPKWCLGEPSNSYGNEDCAQVNFQSDGCWNDCGCNSLAFCAAYWYVCERP